MAANEILLALVAVLGLILLWSKHTFSYWKRKKIPYIEPTPFLGNTKVVFTMKNNFGMHLADIHRDPKVANEAVVGIYSMHQPALLIREPELIKSVLIKDFNKFSNRYVTADQHGDPLAFYNLFFVKNPYWKDIRTKLSPVFTSGKIKQMYPLMMEIGQELEEHLQTYKKDHDSFVTDVKEVCARFTTDSIATIAFGIRADSLKYPDAEFREQGRKMFQFNLIRAFHSFIAFFMPKLVTVFRVKIFPPESTNYMGKTFTHVMAERERSGIKRNDLIDVLVALKKDGELNEDKAHYVNNKAFLVAQAIVFLTAGFETSSTTMSFALYELAKQPELQKRLRAEIHEAFVSENGNLSYDNINSLEYLGMVLDEVLRLYPVLPFLDRVYESKTGEADFTLKPYYDYTLPHGLPIFISAYGIQHDAKYWPNPEHFDPERFSKENRKNIDPMTYLPFGNGPHNCIGMRIGLLQAKIGLAYLFKNHFVEFCDGNTEMEFDRKSFLKIKCKQNYAISYYNCQQGRYLIWSCSFVLFGLIFPRSTTGSRVVSCFLFNFSVGLP